MDEQEIRRLSHLTTFDELDDARRKAARYGGLDIADIRAIIDEHTRRVVAELRKHEGSSVEPGFFAL
jgi:hypothetical protein